jgi:hypothetical protein
LSDAGGRAAAAHDFLGSRLPDQRFLWTLAKPYIA